MSGILSDLVNKLAGKATKADRRHYDDAVLRGDLATIRKIDNRFDQKFRHENKNESLWRAVCKDHIDVAEYFLDAKAHPNHDKYGNGKTVVMDATSVKMVKLLQGHGADLTKCDNNGCGMYFYNVKNPDIVRYLIQQAISVNAADNTGRTPLFQAIEASLERYETGDAGTQMHPGVLETIRILVTSGVNRDYFLREKIRTNFDPEGSGGLDAVMFAAVIGADEALQELMRAKFECKRRNANGYDAERMAHEVKYIEMVGDKGNKKINLGFRTGQTACWATLRNETFVRGIFNAQDARAVQKAVTVTLPDDKNTAAPITTSGKRRKIELS